VAGAVMRESGRWDVPMRFLALLLICGCCLDRYLVLVVYAYLPTYTKA
jgi:hypothetical protein